ncbi:L-lactate dehydrogenase (cytochrome) [Idiomarina fontislapidosi]|uniref:Alpha-hydroxy-acid oxidizing enzyme n=1 Tax=Idiomarina fontislapidosi TaxID=263723 RepID=A0A432Y9E3_9GAMM|nr:alpha-hydroxy acid oxidase [Idiomarina fontislapidosi]PYE34501.1 L-lactate dehydrogenase (cytochrome) [Idiomarina fontislapidosi]RUO57542.1 alpha-hydroxy-acid oxidizing enzyme [Idiomarina fontislapidosi]
MRYPITPAGTEDFRQAAERRLPRALFDYIDGGAFAEQTAQSNIHSFTRWRLQQRVMRDVEHINLAVERLGQCYSAPLALGPVGLAGMMARRGETQAFRAAQRQHLPFCASTVSLCGIEEIHQHREHQPAWFQLYMMRDREFVAQLLDRVRKQGVEVLVVTVDLAVLGVRYRDVRNGFESNSRLAKLRRTLDFIAHPKWLWDVGIKGGPHVFGNLTEAVPNARQLTDFKRWVDEQFDPSVSWDDIAWLRARWPGKLVIKGILHEDDALQAVKVGADGLIISNHGGRQLDGAACPIDVLPQIHQHLKEHDCRAQVELWLDGGIRNPQDLLIALALGADGGLLGRAWVYALASQGEAGVSALLSQWHKALSVSLALMGCTDIAQLNCSHLQNNNK